MPSHLKRIDGSCRESVVSLCSVTALFLPGHPQLRRRVYGTPEQPDIFVILLDLIPHFVSELFICGERQQKSTSTADSWCIFCGFSGKYASQKSSNSVVYLYTYSLTFCRKPMSSRNGEGVSWAAMYKSKWHCHYKHTSELLLLLNTVTQLNTQVLAAFDVAVNLKLPSSCFCDACLMFNAVFIFVKTLFIFVVFLFFIISGTAILFPSGVTCGSIWQSVCGESQIMSPLWLHLF